MPLRLDFALSFYSLIAKCPVLWHLLRFFDLRFKENFHCHPVFITDINICRESNSKGLLKSMVRAITAVRVITHRFLSKLTTKHPAIIDDTTRYTEFASSIHNVSTEFKGHTPKFSLYLGIKYRKHLRFL